MEQLDRLVASTAVVLIDNDLAWTQADLRRDCQKAGLAIADRVHTGDLWIAATAVRYDIPLVAHDGIFKNVPGLHLITEL